MPFCFTSANFCPFHSLTTLSFPRLFTSFMQYPSKICYICISFDLMALTYTLEKSTFIFSLDSPICLTHQCLCISTLLIWLDAACVANSCETFFFLAIRSTRWSRRRWRREPSRRRRDASPTTVHQTSSKRRESWKEKSSCCVMGNFSFIIRSFFLRRFI